MSSEILQVFPQPVMIFNDMIKLTKAEKDYLNKDQEMQDRIGVSGVQCTADYYLLNKKELLNVKNQIQNCVDIYAEKVMKLNRAFQNIFITTSWMNVNKPGKNHHPHTHPNSILSGVVYVSENPQHHTTVFLNTAKPMEFSYTEYNWFNSSAITLKAKYLGCIIFPSTLNHLAETNTTKDIRKSLTFNTFINGTFGGDNLCSLKIGHVT
tara:strand:+ start:7241 stop:7867 length:627 start_codon:yes stop_codon:yes gene_type:complete